MDKWVLILLTFIVLAAIPAMAVEPGSFEGDWVGGYRVDASWVLVNLHLSRNAAGISGTLDVPSLGALGKPVEDLAIQSSSIRFRVVLDSSDLSLKGDMNGKQIHGTIRTGSREGPLQLMKSVRLEPRALARYQGTYEVDHDHYAQIRFWSELGENQLGYFDEPGEMRSLFPMGDDAFFVGSGVSYPVPLKATIVFTRGPQGEIRSFSLQTPEGSRHICRRTELSHQEDVTFRNGPVELAGTLFTPLVKGPHPALVVVHGSGPADRGASFPFVWFLVRHGIALLVYDKRGVGLSSGDWKTSSFEALADDAVAAVRFLKGRPEIDARRIGVFGVSQGGWIAPLAASRSNDVAFVISVSGPGVTPAEETVDFLKNELQLAGLTARDIDEAVRLTSTAFEYVRSGEGWDAYLAARQKVMNEPWFPYLGLSDDRGDWHWELRRLTNDYDPIPALKRTRCPTLAFFGGLDTNVVAMKSIEKWSSALGESDSKDFTIVLLGQGNHLLMEAETGSMFEFPQLRNLIPDYRRILLEWLSSRLLGLGSDRSWLAGYGTQATASSAH